MEKYFTYLEKLRKSGETNMMGAVPYLQRQFPELAHDRARAREMITGGDWDDYHSYDLVVNTSAWERIADLTPAVAEFARAWFAKQN